MVRAVIVVVALILIQGSMWAHAPDPTSSPATVLSTADEQGVQPFARTSRLEGSGHFFHHQCDDHLLYHMFGLVPKQSVPVSSSQSLSLPRARASFRSARWSPPFPPPIRPT